VTVILLTLTDDVDNEVYRGCTMTYIRVRLLVCRRHRTIHRFFHRSPGEVKKKSSPFFIGHAADSLLLFLLEVLLLLYTRALRYALGIQRARCACAFCRLPVSYATSCFTQPRLFSSVVRWFTRRHKYTHTHRCVCILSLEVNVCDHSRFFFPLARSHISCLLFLLF
jgi:hypothetical protein